MKNRIAAFLGLKPTRKEDDEFSHFFRETPLAEKERIIGEAVRKSTEDQRAVIEKYEQLAREGKVKAS